MPKRKSSSDKASKQQEAEELEKGDLEEAMSFFSGLHKDDSPAVAAAVSAAGGAKKKRSDENSEKDSDSSDSESSSSADENGNGEDLAMVKVKAAKKSSEISSDDDEDDDSDNESEDGNGNSSDLATVKVKAAKESSDDEGDDNDDGSEDDNESSSDDGSGGKGEDNTKVYPRGKPPPVGYTCNACKQSGHWIYDCSKYADAKRSKKVQVETKKPVKAAAAAAESEPHSTESNDPATNQEKKVFVQGLPFDSTQVTVKRWFEERCGPVKAINLICFEDSKRCKGMAYIIFDDAKGKNKALVLNGEKMAAAPSAGKGKEAGGGKGSGERWLNISEPTAKPVASGKGSSGRGGGKGSGGGGGGRGGGKGACFRCGKRGHLPNACTQKKMCYRCKSTDHLSGDCPKRKN